MSISARALDQGLARPTLDGLMAPDAVAIVGTSADPARIGGARWITTVAQALLARCIR